MSQPMGSESQQGRYDESYGMSRMTLTFMTERLVLEHTANIRHLHPGTRLEVTCQTEMVE